MKKQPEFSYFYPVTIMAQTAFRDDGTTYVHGVEVLGEGHIMYQGRLMCGQNLEVAKKKAKNKTIRKERVLGVSLCKVCQEKYKANLYSDWNRWINGTPVKMTSKEMVMK